MPVNLFPAPYSRIQQAPIIISPTPASHALPQLGGSLGMGMAHPHPAMSTAMMPDAPAAAIGLSMNMSSYMPSQSVRVPGAVLTNGVANPYIQHNSLASAGPAYPYNASIFYSDLPEPREQQHMTYMRSLPRSQEFGKFDSGIYAYAGGMPDTRAGNPRPSFQQNYPAMGMTGGHVMAPTATGYASTIYPDSPTTRGSSTREARDCSACRAQRRREEHDLAQEIPCDCHNSHNRRHRSREPRIRNTRTSTDSSSDEDDEEVRYAGKSDKHHRRQRGESERRGLGEAEIGHQRTRQHSSRSGRRNASRAPGLPSLEQLSFNGEPPRATEPFSDRWQTPFTTQRDRIREEGDVRTVGVGAHRSSPSRYQNPEDGSHNHVTQMDDLRMDDLNLRDFPEDYHKRFRRRADSPLPSNAGMANASSYFQPQSPRAFHVMHKDRSRSRNRDELHLGRASSSVQRSPLNRSEEALPQQRIIQTQQRDDFDEVYPLSSRRHSPSRMHRHLYTGNQPAALNTHSKLHPLPRYDA